MSDVNTGEPDRPSAGGEDDGVFHTDTATASGVRQRGMGVGAEELAAQGDPAGAPTSPADGPPVRAPDGSETDFDSATHSNRRA